MIKTLQSIRQRIARTTDSRQSVHGSEAEATHARKVLFVCTANVCRSPMAEAIFNALAEDDELDIRAESAGVAALKGEEIAPNASVALGEAGIYPGEHHARQVSRTMLEEADLVLVMGPQHIAKLYQLFGNLPHRVYTLPEYANGPLKGNPPGEVEIPDPYGHTITSYRASVRQLSDCIERLIERLKK